MNIKIALQIDPFRLPKIVAKITPIINIPAIIPKISEYVKDFISHYGHFSFISSSY
mgnify:CR=1 FL=1